MSGLIKKYLPYALIIFAVFLIVPIFFANKTMENFFGIALYFIFLVTTVACSAIYCSKHGLDFLFALIAPIAFLFTMIIYCGGFSNITNIILLGVYLVAGIFGLFLGDLAFGDERHKKEQRERREAEEILLEAKRRDEHERERMADVKKEPQRNERKQRANHKTPQKRSAQHTGHQRYSQRTNQNRSTKKQSPRPNDDDDFDYDKYLADIDRKTKLDNEIDDILKNRE